MTPVLRPGEEEEDGVVSSLGPSCRQEILRTQVSEVGGSRLTQRWFPVKDAEDEGERFHGPNDGQEVGRYRSDREV